MCYIVSQSGMREEYPENFKSLVSQVDLMTFNDEAVTSFTQSVHGVPISKGTELKNVPVKLEAASVIEDTDGLAEWVSNLVIYWW